MAGADIGGDTSVEWDIVADHFRKSKPPTSGQNGNGWKHHGIDEADIGPGHDFDISIKIPRELTDAVKLANTLAAAAAAAQAQVGAPGSRVSFRLPIEQTSPDQIQIRWESAPVLASRPHGNVMATTMAARSIKAVKGKSRKKVKTASKKKTKARAAKKKR